MTTVKLPDIRAAMAIGTCDGVLYTTVRDGKTESYIHEFRSRSRPVLAVSADGKNLLILGGRYQFLDTGINDK